MVLNPSTEPRLSHVFNKHLSTEFKSMKVPLSQLIYIEVVSQMLSENVARGCTIAGVAEISSSIKCDLHIF